ncbi:uncharacterized protein BDZ99DRAFT_478873 [Mytilinidion resinicola]|uniref:Uncharacterized protein n=1 Tax=Mytilinidion resinicola TaxID=574789 RepID=A0A6A6YHL7_9PEZI|nr:uncharacterized protein BDZ99DRAFT_478873 [Mytilinidion resinicola]KAF2807387.1 hypothetical protein BDZ99DRAFT_478873 [Mytilinidion resinicola]
MAQAPETLPDFSDRLSNLSPALPALLWNAHDDVLRFHACILARDIATHATVDRHYSAFTVARIVVQGASLPLPGEKETDQLAKICARIFRYLYGEVEEIFKYDLYRGMIDLVQTVEEKGPGLVTHGTMLMLCELYVLADDHDDVADRKIWFDGIRKAGVGLCKWTEGKREWNEDVLELLYYVEFTLGCKMGAQREGRALLFELSVTLRRLADTLPAPKSEELVRKIQRRVDGMQKVCLWMDQAEMDGMTAALRDIGIGSV